MNDSTPDPKRLEAGDRRPPPPVAEMHGGGGGDNGDGIDLRELIAVLWHGKWMIAAVTAVVFALALAYAFHATPIYEVDALIQIEQQNQTPPGASSSVLSMLFPIAAPADTEIQIMTSRSVLQPTVEEAHLNIRVDGDGFLARSRRAQAIGVTELQVPDEWKGEELTLVANGNDRYTLASPTGQPILQGTVGSTASGRNGTVKIAVAKLDLPAGESVSLKRLYDQQAVAALQGQLSVAEQGKDTGIVKITLQGRDPALTRAVLNVMANAYLKQNVAAMATQAQKSLLFVNQQLPQLKRQLDAAQGGLAHYQTQHGAVALDQKATALLQQLTALKAQQAQLQLTESAMRQRYTGSYPGLVGLRSQEREAQRQIDAVGDQIKLLPSQEQGYLEIMQSVQVDQQLYTALLAKAQDLQVTAASTVGSARIVDYAVTPIQPVKPRKSLIAVLGFILGLFLGILAAFLRRALFRAITAPDELEQDLGLPVYAVVQHSAIQIAEMRKRKAKKSEALPLLAAEYPDDVAVEAIRSLRTSLGVALLDAPRKVICFIGAAPSVGKSFLTANIAHVLGSSGNRVLVIDADLRRGHLHRYFSTRPTPGLSAFLAGQAELGNVILPSAYDNGVDFIPTGARPTDPYTLISGQRFAALIEQCARDYDFVLVDVPPVLAVAEGLTVARLATANLIVVKAGVQTRHEIRTAMNRMQQNDATLLGFVLNDLTKRTSTYSYNRYGYSYQYKYEKD